jgi:hypothetical protein
MTNSPFHRSARTTSLLSTLTISGLLVSGCASTPVLGASTHAVVPTKTTATMTSTDPAALALRDARALLAGFTPPPKAAKLDGEPRGTPNAMRQTAFNIDVATKIELTAWWVVDSPASTVYSWLAAHHPAPGTHGWGTVGSNPSIPYVSYEVPSTDHLRYSTITAEVGPLSASRAVVRLDVEVVYRPVRPRSETVPATPYLLLTVQPRGNSNTTTTPIEPTTTLISDKAKIAKVVQLINALPLELAQVRSCPVFQEPLLALEFKSAPSGPTLAEARIDPGPCGSVEVTIAGVRQPDLDPADSTGAENGLSGRVASLLGVPLP